MKRRLRSLRTLIRAHPAESALWCAAVLLRVFLLNQKSLWLDESMTLALARAPMSALLPLVRTNELLPPLHYALMHFWIRGFADPVLGLRVFSLFSGLGTLAVFQRSCRRLIPRQATLAFALAALSSYWIDVAQSGRPYSLYLLLAAASFELFLQLKDRWRARPGLAYALVGALGLYTHYYFGFALLAQLAYAAYRHRRRPEALAPWLWTCAFWAAALAPWLPSLRAQLSIYAGKPTLTEPFGADALAALFGGMFLNVSVLSPAAPWLEKRVDKREKEILGVALCALFVPLAAAKLAELILGRPMTQARYFVFLSLPAYLLAAFLIGRLRRLPRMAASAVLSILLAGGVIGYDYSCLRLDSRLAALSGALRAAARPGDVVVHVNPFYYTSLKYYYLPELPQYILDDSSPMLNWKALPGGDPVIPAEILSRLPRVLVVDPDRALFERRVGTASGVQLASWFDARKRKQL